MKKEVGYVTFKTRVGAMNAVKSLDGSRTDTDGDVALSVRHHSHGFVPFCV
jgi:hypothetical protein